MPDPTNRRIHLNARSNRSQLAPAIEAVCFWLILLVVAMRPLVPETYDSALYSVGRVTDSHTITTPATTAWFDAAIWLAALGATLSAAIRRAAWRWTGLEIGGIALLVAAVLSSLATGNVRLAINASCDWLTAIVLVIALVNLCRSRWRMVLVLSVITASGLASAAKCALQITNEFAETRQHYNANKAEIWRQQGIPLDDATVELYERRLDTHEAFGFLSHSNVQGTWLGVAGFAALALGTLATRARWQSVIFMLLAVILFAAVLMTGSKGALMATAAAVVLWLALRSVQERLRRHWRAALIAGWAIVLAGAGGAVWLGISRGGLPGDSLQFRWNYWQVTRKIIAEHPWTGVGALNFGPAYLERKPIEYPEEIKDPHNFVMAILSQWGILGGVGLALLLVGASIVAARAWGEQPDRPEAEIPTTTPLPATSFVYWRWMIPIVIGFVLLRLWIMRGWLQEDVGGRALVFFDLGFYGLLWILCFAGAVALATRNAIGMGHVVKLPCLCGVVLVLLQNTIGFSLFTPAVLTPLAAMSAILLIRSASSGQDRPSALALTWPVALAALGLMAFSWLMLIPVTHSSHFLQQARSHSDKSLQQYRRAAAADPLDPTPLVERADLLAQVPTMDNLSAALTDLKDAVFRVPNDLSLYHRRARFLERRYELSGAAVDLLGAIGAMRRVVDMYPNSPDHHAARAHVLAHSATVLNHPSLIDQARNHYQQALDLDAARPAHELRRWSPKRRQEIEQRLRALEESGSSPQLTPTSVPSSPPISAPTSAPTSASQ